jgi:fructokinase
MAEPLYGAIELGGTKIIVAMGTADGRLLESRRLETAAPEANLRDILAFFASHPTPAALGVAAFGPIGIAPGARDYGRLGATPKPGWAGFDLVGALAGVGAPIALQTDVAAAAIAEYAQGAAAGCRVAAYLTVGTGIGGCLTVDGVPLPGTMHAEMGHVGVVRMAGDDFVSRCPSHPNCLEGLASGPALAARRASPAHAGNADSVIPFYVAQLVHSLILLAAPQRIVIGGGVASLPGFHRQIAVEVGVALAGYLALDPPLDAIIVPPALGDTAGLQGALALAIDADLAARAGMRR